LPNSPFRDDRARKALSMLIDRDLFIETFGTSRVRSRRNRGADTLNRRCLGDEGFWLTCSQEFGENAKFFRFDLKQRS
jgi:ABC-type transport system substrate-binding protein